MSRAVARALSAGTFTGVGLCAAATLARALGVDASPRLALVGVLVLFLTQPLQLAVAAVGFFAAGERRYALAAMAALAILLVAALGAVAP